MQIRQIELATSAIRELTIRSRQFGAVNLGQGFPDEDTWPEVRDCAVRALHSGTDQYTDPRGHPGLRSMIAPECCKGQTVDPETQIVVTCGATEGMIVSLEALVPLHSEILIFSPFYENYRLQDGLASLRPRYLTVREPDLTFTREDLERSYTPELSAIILCTPSNPAGNVFTRQELEMVVSFAIERDLLIFPTRPIGISMERTTHTSVCSIPGASDRSVVVASFGKTFSVTGWRVGHLISSLTFVERIGAVHDFHTITAPHPFQVAIRFALDELGEDFYSKVRAEFSRRKALLDDALKEAGFEFFEPIGIIFFLVRLFPRLGAEGRAVFGSFVDAGRDRPPFRDQSSCLRITKLIVSALHSQNR